MRRAGSPAWRAASPARRARVRFTPRRRPEAGRGILKWPGVSSESDKRPPDHGQNDGLDGALDVERRLHALTARAAHGAAQRRLSDELADLPGEVLGVAVCGHQPLAPVL